MLFAVVLGLFATLAAAAPAADDAAPFAVDESRLYFWHYPTANSPVRLFINQLSSANINRNAPFKFLIHGWDDSVDSDWYQPTINAYLNMQSATVIAFDWERYALGNYFDSVRAAREVAAIIAQFLHQVNRVNGVPLANMHLIGHSLGAHIAGFTGKLVRSSAGANIGRITGLDPAGPLFNGNSADQRLTNTDADFVDIMHTDGMILGYGDPIGDADYYPNGGTAFQEGCWIWQFGCSHNRSPIYFTESILFANNYIGRQCDSENNFDRGNCGSNPTAVMGESAPGDARGRYYLTTNRAYPFGKGQNGA